MGGESAELLTAQLNESFAETGSCAAFHDWDLVANHTVGLRRTWVKWATTPAARAARFTHFRLGRARLLKAAVWTAHIAFSPQPFIVHRSRKAYAAARSEHLSVPTPIDELVALQATIAD